MTTLRIQPTSLRLNVHYILMQMGFWAMYGAIAAYLATLLLARGFTNGQVGLVVALRCLAGVIFQPLLGGFADRHPNIPLKRIFGVCLGLSFVVSLGLFVPTSLGTTSLILFIIGGFEISAYPLMDSMALQYIRSGVNIRYSLGRGIGSLAYALCCVFLGFQVGRWGVESTLITHVVLVGVQLLLVITYPTCPYTPPLEEDKPPKPQSALSLLKTNPTFTIMLLGVFFGMTGVLPMSNFLINIIQDRGGSDADLGIALFFMAATELPAAFLFGWLHRRYGVGKVLVVSMVFCMAKTIALLFAFNLTTVMLAMPLQMLGYGLFTPASVFFVDKNVPAADQVRGQTMMMVASNGLGGVAGSFLAGGALDIWGTDAMLLLCIFCGLLSVVFTLLALKMKANKG